MKEGTLHYAAPKVNDDTAAAKIIHTLIGTADREHLVAVFLSAANVPIGVHTIAVGALTSVGTTPREVFKAAVKTNAAAMVLGHNHPAGDPTPSAEDVEFTKATVQAGKLLGIQVHDHIVVTPDGAHSSMRNLGFLE